MTCLVMFFGEIVMQLNVWTLFEAYVNYQMYFIFICMILSAFLPVWHNKGVHYSTFSFYSSMLCRSDREFHYQ